MSKSIKPLQFQKFMKAILEYAEEFKNTRIYDTKLIYIFFKLHFSNKNIFEGVKNKALRIIGKII